MAGKSGDGERPRAGHGRRLARWSFGMLLATLRYLLHRVPSYRRNRREVDEPPLPDMARELPGDATNLQRATDGIGPLYHRRYAIAFTDAERDPQGLIEALRRDLNVASPVEFSRFEPLQVNDSDAGLRVGDEYLVRLPGPWNGPVRVVDATPTSFRLATLRGHMEAGEIEFRATRNDRGWTVFAIESWARSGDRIYHWLYDRLPIARELQLHMWAHFCQRVARIGGGIVMTNVELHTCTRIDDRVPA